MKTEILCADSSTQKNDTQIEFAANIIKSGGLVAFPTETVYGLGADATKKDAAKKIYAAKGRPSDNPLIIHISRPEDAEKYAFTTPLYYKLAKAFMPGPITVIMKKKDTIPFEVTGGLDTVAVRCPDHNVARALIEASGTAIAAPSANISGSPSPTCAEHVIKDMDGKIDAIIDGGSSEIGLESTIVAIDSDTEVTLLRPGAITADALSCICAKVHISSAITNALKENERPLSPGMKYRHYAPSSPLVLLDGSRDEFIAFCKEEQKKTNCAILAFTEDVAQFNDGYVIDIGGACDLAEQAKRLFAALREVDNIDTNIIYAPLPPQSGLGLALYNRMIRAAAHTVKKLGK